MAKNKIPTRYSVAVKSVEHSLGVGYVAAVFIYMHYRLDDEDDDSETGFGYKFIEKKVLWRNGNSEKNWEAIMRYLNFKKRLVPGGEAVKYHERTFLGYALPADQKGVIDKAFHTIVEELTYDKALTEWGLEVVEPDPILIHCDEKHSEFNYVARTPEEAADVYLSILDRRKENMAYEWMRLVEMSTEKPEFTIEEVEALPESMKTEKRKMTERLKAYQRDFNQVEDNRRTYDLIIKALKDTDPYLAKTLLNRLSRNEYGGIEVLHFDEIDHYGVKLEY